MRSNVGNKLKLDSNNELANLESYVLYTSRVAKVVKGGKKMRFRALVVVGDRNGKIGLALAKARDPKTAIEKAIIKAKKNQISIQLNEHTIQYEIFEKFKASKIFFKPAMPGTGIICSNSIRPIIELAGIKDIFAKIYGSSNKINNAYCTFNALSKFKK